MINTIECPECGATNQDDRERCYFCQYSFSESAERSGVLQGCLPSATGSASNAASVQKSQCGMDGSEVSKPSDTRKEDGHGADSSVVQLPVSELAGLEHGRKSDCDEDEELIQSCIEVIRREKVAKISMLQRRLRQRRQSGLYVLRFCHSSLPAWQESKVQTTRRG